MEPNPEPLATYYNPSRRRSFFLSRLFVMSSMLVLVLALVVNISFLYSQQRTDTRSRADFSNPQNNLPSLPAGCEYQQTGDNVKVICPTKTPSLDTTSEFPVTVELPQLPAQCAYQTTTTGSTVKCNGLQSPLPTAAVTFSPSCTVDPTNNNSLTCVDKNNKRVSIALPTLPKGCSYKKLSGAYYVTCSATTTP